MSAYGVSAHSNSIIFSGAVQSRVMGWSVYTNHGGSQQDLHGPRPLSESGMKVLSKQPPRQVGNPSISRGETIAKMLPGAWGGLAFAHSSGTSQIIHKHNDRVPRKRMKSASGGPASLCSTGTSRSRQGPKTATMLPDLVFVWGEYSCLFVGWKKMLLGITRKWLLIFRWVKKKSVTGNNM